MAQYAGSIPYTGYVAPADDTDTYAVTKEEFNQGGYRAVADSTARLAITSSRRKVGMLVKQLDTGTYWTLSGGILDANWVDTSFSLKVHNFIDTTNHPVSGLTTGYFLKAIGANTYAFAPHGLTYSDVGAAASSHTHGNITSIGAIGSTANLPLITTTSGVVTVGSFGTEANTFCQGNDSRVTTAYSYSQIGHLPLSGGSMANTNLVTNMNADFLNGAHGSYYGIYNTDTLGDNIDFNAITYPFTSNLLTSQPFYNGNYTGLVNQPFSVSSYGQLLTFGGILGFFPAQIAFENENEGGLAFRTAYRPGQNTMANDWHYVWDNKNSNLSTVDWNAKNITASGTITLGGYALTFPNSAGTNSQVLTTNGSGILSWTDKGGGTSGGITAINSQTGATQSIVGTSPITVSSSGNTHTIAIPFNGDTPNPGDLWSWDDQAREWTRIPRGSGSQVLYIVDQQASNTGIGWESVLVLANDPHSSLSVSSNASTWDCTGGYLNWVVSITANWALTITNAISGMSGNLRITVSGGGLPTITLAASGVTFRGNGSLVSLTDGVYHLCWDRYSTNIDYNIAKYV